jgi:hypothetical protein
MCSEPNRVGEGFGWGHLQSIQQHNQCLQQCSNTDEQGCPQGPQALSWNFNLNMSTCSLSLEGLENHPDHHVCKLEYEDSMFGMLLMGRADIVQSCRVWQHLLLTRSMWQNSWDVSTIITELKTSAWLMSFWRYVIHVLMSVHVQCKHTCASNFNIT